MMDRYTRNKVINGFAASETLKNLQMMLKIWKNIRSFLALLVLNPFLYATPTRYFFSPLCMIYFNWHVIIYLNVFLFQQIPSRSLVSTKTPYRQSLDSIINPSFKRLLVKKVVFNWQINIKSIYLCCNN